MNSFGFLFDEHVASALLEQLATPDPELLIWIEAHNCLLVTNNPSSMPPHLVAHLSAGRHIPGIVQLPRRFDVGAILTGLRLIWGAGEPDEFRDRITYLPLR